MEASAVVLAAGSCIADGVSFLLGHNEKERTLDNPIIGAAGRYSSDSRGRLLCLENVLAKCACILDCGTILGVLLECKPCLCRRL